MSSDRPPRRASILVTCEHAGRDVPPGYAHLFENAAPALRSHRGHDPGALGVAETLAARLAASLLATTVTRLLVETNRSLDHPDLFSEFTRDLSSDERRAIIEAHYLPHRERVRAWIDTADRFALHLGVHSFTDVLHGERRELDIGLLFDPERAPELELCTRWRDALRARREDLRVRLNEPYLGTDDGLTTSLRGEFPADRYAGVEIEIRQGLLTSLNDQCALGELLAATLPQDVDPTSQVR